MGKKLLIASSVLIVFSFALTVSSFGRAKLSTDDFKGYNGSLTAALPQACMADHRVGKIVLAISTNGIYGAGFSPYIHTVRVDCFTGEEVLSCEYPKAARVKYLFAGAFWIGAVVGRDTLVSVGADGWQSDVEMYADEFAVSSLSGLHGNGPLIKRSIIDPTAPEYEGAISEEDIISVYLDTFTQGLTHRFDGTPHKPLFIQVTEKSYAWSYAYAEDFVLFDYRIKNIGEKSLKNVYMGIYVDGDVGAMGSEAEEGERAQDDICGFTETMLRTYGDCQYLDTVNIAWIADNDGDFEEPFSAAPHVTATRIVRTPATNLDVSFNWWISNDDAKYDFGPREKPFTGRWKEDWRDFGTSGMGTPEGDFNKYYVLRNKEFDYDQVYTYRIQQNDTLWMYPHDRSRALELSCALDTRYLLSFGPFDINPGQVLPISFAYVAGENFHSDPANIRNCPLDPDAFYAGLNFADLGTNAMWASWIYDNPGVDTDGDGDSGEFRICVEETSFVDSIPLLDTLTLDTIGWKYVYDTTRADTIWYLGDGVPDFRGASPPPPPDFRIVPSVGSLHMRFNGARSETTKDVFSGLVDFEGYRIYLGRDQRATSYSVVTSYDLEDYNKYVFDPSKAEYVLRDIPFTLDQLRALYGIPFGYPQFDPLRYTRSSPFVHPLFSDSVFYFEPQDYNQSELGSVDGIHKVYPDQPYPSSLSPDSARPEELTDDGYLKYFEYEYVIDNLLPTVPYWVNVTSFDFGSPVSGLASLETSVTLGAKSAYPLSSADEVARQDLKVMVYPNPYRIDAGYRTLGFEGRANPDRPDDRVRTMHFANLPPKCTIRILSLDGDLIREIRHNLDPSNPNAAHETWDLITRNMQLVVSGLYYWTVEAENGKTQIGKLVIIM